MPSPLEKFLSTRSALLSQKGEQQRQSNVQQMAPLQRRQAELGIQGEQQRQQGIANQPTQKDIDRDAMIASVVDSYTKAKTPEEKTAIIGRSVDMFNQTGDAEGAQFAQEFSQLSPEQQEMRINAKRLDFENRGILDKAVQPKPTSLQQNVQAAFPNDPEAQRKAMAQSISKPLSTTNIDLGKSDDAAPPEKGMRNIRDGEGKLIGREVIPGSALDRKNKASLKQNRIATVGRVIKNKNTVNDIRSVISKASGSNTGIFGKALSFIPGTDQFDFRQNIETLMSRLAIDSMLELKAKSPTGSTGFGALSQKELEVMQKEIASLEQAQSPAQFKANAMRVLASYEKNTQLLELGFQEAATTPDERLEQILDVGLNESDARVIMASEGLEMPESAQRTEEDILSQYGL